MRTAKWAIVLIFWLANPVFATPSNWLKTNLYIKKTWNVLTRDLAKCATYTDIKMQSGTPTLYFPAQYQLPEQIKSVQQKCQLTIKSLPYKINNIGKHKFIKQFSQGLLYLPHPYVVPGGMFNEMYGWDSYFIIRGLLVNNELPLAKGMLENFFFEIEHYGAILNANRGYYLTRSQPPFLSSMVRSVYQQMEKKNGVNLTWLANAYSYIKKDYQLWTTGKHLAGNTELSRYYDFNDGGITELKDITYKYYQNAAEYFYYHPAENKSYIEKADQHDLRPTYKICIKKFLKVHCKKYATVALTPTYYAGDRATRESGLDISFRFGPYGAGTIDYAPVDLNSLLYKTEIDLAWISKKLNKRADTNKWTLLAKKRLRNMNKYFWNAQSGLYEDYNFIEKKRVHYPYLSTYFPLWVGAANKTQANAVSANLKLFEHQGGLTCSNYSSGAQWDYPYGWAPLHLVTIEGLRLYGQHKKANELSILFLNTIAKNFVKYRTIKEKYNVVTASSQIKIKVGYPTNEIGFGWTNGVFTVLLETLQKHIDPKQRVVLN